MPKGKSIKKSSVKSAKKASTRKQRSETVTKVAKTINHGMRIAPPGEGWTHVKELSLRDNTYDIWTRQEKRKLSVPLGEIDDLAALFGGLGMGAPATDEITMHGSHDVDELDALVTQMAAAAVGGARRQSRKLKRRKPRRPVPWWHF
jgi:hypothetical protein